MSDNSGTDEYRYARLGSHLVCLDQPLYGPVRTLLNAGSRAALASLGLSSGDAVRDCLFILRNRLRGNGGYPALPAFGHVGMAVHRGYKLFDLGSRTVTKVFSERTPEGEARAEIEICRSVSAVSAAPRFVAADSDSRWYTEEFVVGVHGTESGRARDGAFIEFLDDVEQCLLELVAIEEPLTVDARQYIATLAEEVHLEPWISARVGDEALAEIRGFRDELSAWLDRELGDAGLMIVPSHGDFGLVNVIIDGDEFRVIDWEGTRHGSLLADCFNFVFVERYYGRARGDVTTEMQQVADRYLGTVRERRPDLLPATELPMPIAMRLYYLERLRLLLERDVTKNLVGVVRKSIAMFREFDRNASYPAMTA